VASQDRFCAVKFVGAHTKWTQSNGELGRRQPVTRVSGHEPDKKAIQRPHT